MEMLFQYLAVVIILFITLIFVLKKILHYRRKIKAKDSCCGCGLANSCNKTDRNGCC